VVKTIKSLVFTHFWAWSMILPCSVEENVLDDILEHKSAAK